MQVRSPLVVALLSLSPLACTNTPNGRVIDASGAVDRPVLTDASGQIKVTVDATGSIVDGGSQCGWPAALDNGAVAGCAPARAFVTCAEPGGSSSYAASEPMGCVSCSGTCQDSCAVSEFALSCATAQPDAAVSSGPAHGCRFASAFPSGSVLYCCPCQ
jgi:hypothetical protein